MLAPHNWLENPSTRDQFFNAELSDDDMMQALNSLTSDNVNKDILSLIFTTLWNMQTPDLPALTFDPLDPPHFIDTCGTGGSGRAGYNTSTTVAFVLAAMGVPVLKFGNRAASSPSGSFDFLTALGLPANPTPDWSVRCFNKTRLGFLMAPSVYPQLAKLAPFRKRVGKPTIFNYLGPLLHPYQPTHRLLGCSSADMLPLLADHISQQENNVSSLLIRSESGVDEALPDESYQAISVLGAGSLREGESGVSAREQGHDIHEPPISPRGEGTFSAEENVAFFRALIHPDTTRTVDAYTREQVLLNAALGLNLWEPDISVEHALVTLESALLCGRVLRFVERFMDVSLAL